jgi:hypothetical protein
MIFYLAYFAITPSLNSFRPMTRWGWRYRKAGPFATSPRHSDCRFFIPLGQ